MTMAKELRMCDKLIKIGEVCTKEKISTLASMRDQVSEAISHVGAISTRDVKKIGKEDVLIRLQRNTNSLHYLLFMVHQVTECMNAEVYDLISAIERNEAQKAEHNTDKWREEYERELKKEQNARARAKAAIEAAEIQDVPNQ